MNTKVRYVTGIVLGESNPPHETVRCLVCAMPYRLPAGREPGYYGPAFLAKDEPVWGVSVFGASGGYVLCDKCQGPGEGRFLHFRTRGKLSYAVEKRLKRSGMSSFGILWDTHGEGSWTWHRLGSWKGSWPRIYWDIPPTEYYVGFTRFDPWRQYHTLPRASTPHPWNRFYKPAQWDNPHNPRNWPGLRALHTNQG